MDDIVASALLNVVASLSTTTSTMTTVSLFDIKLIFIFSFCIIMFTLMF